MRNTARISSEFSNIDLFVYLVMKYSKTDNSTRYIVPLAYRQKLTNLLDCKYYGILALTKLRSKGPHFIEILFLLQ